MEDSQLTVRLPYRVLAGLLAALCLLGGSALLVAAVSPWSRGRAKEGVAFVASAVFGLAAGSFFG